MDEIVISREELAKTLKIWLAVAGVKHASMIRDLWTRRDQCADDARRDAARRMLANWLAQQFETSRYTVTRPKPSGEPLFGFRPEKDG